MRHLPLLAALILIAIVPLEGATQVTTPDPEALPHATAPLGLTTVPLPDTMGEIETGFAALPPTIAGVAQGDWIEVSDRIQVPYGGEAPASGHPMVLAAISFEWSDFFPADFTAGDYVTMALATDEAESSAGGRDGELAWVRAEISVGVADKPGTPEVSGTLYTLSWGDIDGGLLYTASADSPERLEALVSAFVTTFGGSTATPTPGASPTATGGTGMVST